MIVDARTLPPDHAVEADLCIVGGGVAGVALARSFVGTPVRVCVLESGGEETDPEAQGLARGEVVGQPYWSLAYARMRRLGGTSTHWCNPLVDENPGAFFRPLDALDFERRDWVPESGWPISKPDLDPYYARAHELLRIGPYDYDPETWSDGDRRPAPPFDTERLRTAMFQFGRADLFYTTYRDELDAAENVTVYVHAHALEFDVADARVEAVRASTLAGGRLEVRAREVVLATGGIENARMLLLPHPGRPDGIGTDHDLVGRYFMEHPDFVLGYVEAAAERPMRAAKLYVRQNVRGVDVIGKVGVTEAVQREEGLLNAGVLLVPSSLRWHGHLRSRGYDSLRVLRSGLLHKDLPAGLGRHAGRVAAAAPTFARHLLARVGHRTRKRFDETARRPAFLLRYMTEQAPNPASRVTLSRRRDAFGLPRTRLEWRLTRADVESVLRTQDLIGAELERDGWGRLVPAPLDLEAPAGVRGGYHHMGTTRMHPSPRRGVVDPDGRVHGTANLFVAGSSVFPTGGFANPTLTILALTLRLGDHLAGRLEARPVAASRPAVAG